jgi:hypothetical protein
MKLFNYNREDYYFAAIKVRERLEFQDSSLKGKIRTEHMEHALRAYAIFKRTDPVKQNPLWRLTAPVFLLFSILVVILVLPVRWLLTGRFGLTHDKGLGKVISQWQKKLNW